MKPRSKSDSGSNHSEHASSIQRCILIAGAVCLVILLNGCASARDSVGPDPWHYNPNTGYPVVGWSPGH
jgi:hypothetical protein